MATVLYLDSHGMWITKTEDKQLMSGENFDEIEWETKVPPKWAPK